MCPTILDPLAQMGRPWTLWRTLWISLWLYFTVGFPKHVKWLFCRNPLLDPLHTDQLYPEDLFAPWESLWLSRIEIIYCGSFMRKRPFWDAICIQINSLHSNGATFTREHKMMIVWQNCGFWKHFNCLSLATRTHTTSNFLSGRFCESVNSFAIGGCPRGDIPFAL